MAISLIEDQTPITFLKLPFQIDSAASKIKQALHRHGLSSTIRLIFQAQPPLARLLAPAKENIECPTNCITCKLCEKQNQCKQKGVVYHIKCNLCEFNYVGEAKRCAGTRINEHTSKDNSFVFQHFKSRHPMHPLKWKWKIVCKIKDWYARTATETIITHKHNLTSQKVRDLNYAIMYNNN